MNLQQSTCLYRSRNKRSSKKFPEKNHLKNLFTLKRSVMCDSKNESRCSANLLKTPCCVFVNQAIAAYFREATGVLSTGIAAILAAYPQALTAAQADALRAAGVILAQVVAGVALTPDQADAVNSIIVTLVPGVPFTPIVAGNALTAAQIAAITAIRAFATPVGAPPAPVPLTPANIAGIAAALDALVPGAGLGAAFTALFAAATTETATRVTALKATFDEINRLVLAGFQELLQDKCNDKCCESAAEALRSIAINFLRSVAAAPLVGLPAVPPPAPGTPAAPGSLQFILANIVQEAGLAIDAVTSSSDCDKSCDESCDEKCDDKKKKKDCERRLKSKPTRKFKEESCLSSSSSSECESESESEKKHKKYHKKKDSCDDCPLVNNWKSNIPDVKW